MAELKAKVALEAINEKQTLVEIAAKNELHPNQITEWMRQFLANASLVFTEKHPQIEKADSEQKLYEQIGRLQVENDFLKKSCIR